MNYEVKQATMEDLDVFYDDWSLTLEGFLVDEENLDAYFKEITNYTTVKDDFAFYIVKGKQMNERYGLTGDNAYQDELNIIVCKLCSMDNPLTLAVPRFAWGGRWFKDVVDNNARHELEVA